MSAEPVADELAAVVPLELVLPVDEVVVAELPEVLADVEVVSVLPVAELDGSVESAKS